MRHFGRAADGARVALPYAVDVVAPIQVGVDLDERDRPGGIESAKHRDRHAVISTDRDQQSAGRNNLTRHGFGAAVVAAWVTQIVGHVAEIADAYVLAGEKGAANVKIPPIEAVTDAL
jgi:hypothetical protein